MRPVSTMSRSSSATWASTVASTPEPGRKNQGGPERATEEKCIIAPARGLEIEWPPQYLELRAKYGLHAGTIGVLMPAFDAEHEPVEDTLLDAATLTLWLREVLLQAGFAIDEVAKLTSHSLRATLLSWAAKAGCGMKVRRALGGHIKSTDKMAHIYGRENMAEPIRVLDELTGWVRNGDFVPDLGRIGRWIRHSSQLKNDAVSRIA